MLMCAFFRILMAFAPKDLGPYFHIARLLSTTSSHFALRLKQRLELTAASVAQKPIELLDMPMRIAAGVLATMPAQQGATLMTLEFPPLPRSPPSPPSPSDDPIVAMFKLLF